MVVEQSVLVNAKYAKAFTDHTSDLFIGDSCNYQHLMDSFTTVMGGFMGFHPNVRH